MRTLLLLGIGSVAVLVFLIYGPILRIHAVRIEGLTTVAPASVESIIALQRESKRFLLFPQDNIIMFNGSALAKSLTDAFVFETVDVVQDGLTLVVTVKESVLHVAVRADGRTYFVELDGRVIREATADEEKALDVRLGLTSVAEGEVLPVIQPGMPIITIEKLAEGQSPTLSAEQIRGVIEATEGLFGIRIEPLLVTFARPEDQWVSISTAEGYDVLIDVTERISPQIDALNTILDNDPGATYEYVDVRFGEHVFVKEL